jgi:hypothetical protein
VLVKFDYLSCKKKDKGTISQFLIKLTGYSRQQLSRVIAQYRKTGYIKHTPARGNGFHQKYTQKDIRLLAEIDELHETPCGHGIKKIIERSYQVYEENQYQNLTSLSISHLYNLRASTTYQRQRIGFEKPNPDKLPSAKEESPKPMDNQAISALIPFIKVIWTSKKAFIILMWSIRSLSSKRSCLLKKLANTF